MLKKVWVLGLLFTVLVAQAEIYRWVDAQGRVQFSDKAPAGQEASAVSAKNPNVMQSLEVMARPAASSSLVTLYGTGWCGYCKQARHYFAANNISFHDLDIEKSKNANRAYKKLGGKTVPLIVVGDKTMVGFNPGRFERLYQGVREQLAKDPE